MTWNWHGRAWPAVSPTGAQHQGEQYITKTLMAKGLGCLQGGLLYPHCIMSTGSAKLPHCLILLPLYLIAVVHRGLKPSRTSMSTEPYKYPVASTCANVKNVLVSS